MILYLDASAVVKLYVRETGSREVKKLARAWRWRHDGAVIPGRKRGLSLFTYFDGPFCDFLDASVAPD